MPSDLTTILQNFDTVKELLKELAEVQHQYVTVESQRALVLTMQTLVRTTDMQHHHLTQLEKRLDKLEQACTDQPKT